MLQEHILTTGDIAARAGLDALSKKYLGFSYAKTNQLDMFASNQDKIGTLNKDTRKSFKYHKGPFKYDQVYYGCTDVEHTYKVYFKQLPKIAEEGLFKVILLERKYLVVLAEMEYRGFHLDKNMWMDLYQQNLDTYNNTLKDLKKTISEAELPEKFFNFQKELFSTTPDK